MADIATSEIHVFDLPTERVSLTPTGVTVVREIHTKIQPGLNEVVIQGIDPRVDRDSIRIEGSGPATITDIQTDIQDKRMTFEDVYGELESSSEDADTDSSTSMKALVQERIKAKENLEKARINETTAIQVLHFLDSYGNKMAPENMDSNSVNEYIDRYITRRGLESIRRYRAKLDMEIAEHTLGVLAQKISKVEAQRQKAREKIKRQRAQKPAAERRKRDQQRRFWMNLETHVTVLLDSPLSSSSSSSSSTTASNSTSDSGSVVSMTEKSPSDKDVDEREIKLILRYMLPGPKWESRYELSINTSSPAPTAQLTYNAEFENKTSETWKNTRVTLSTLPTTLFSGVGKNIPSLSAWHVELASSKQDSNEGPRWENVVQSVPEVSKLVLANNTSPPAPLPPAVSMPGMSGAGPHASMSVFRPELAEKCKKQYQQSQMIQQAQQAQRMQQSQQIQQYRPPAAPQQNEMSQQFQQQQAPGTSSIDLGTTLDQSFDMTDHTNPSPNLAYEDSTRQEQGMTIKYELPGRRTLTPSTVNRRHAIANLDLKSVTLQHVIIPKSRPVAFLRATIKNTSSIQILRGRVGMKVDGTFLGTTTVPNCAPNDSFELALGVDTSILVTYAKPSMRRQTSGMFVKDEVAVFKRSVWVKNTKSKTANIVVLDQVPVVNSEKLHMGILEPKGLAKDGDKAPVDIEDKGQCVATMGKDGEVRWLLNLDAGKSIRLVLEYEMKAPTGHSVF